MCGDDLVTSRVELLLQSRLLTPSIARSEPNAADSILARPDPGTSVLYYAFGLKRHAGEILSDEQALRLNAVIDQHSPSHRRWHDERNTLRCKYHERLWHYAAADASRRAGLRRELEDWMSLRMKWTQQEHLAAYRFALDVWGLLTGEQQTKLIRGEWKAYAKQETGHTRGNATAKTIVRALGKPDDQPAFDQAVADWSMKHTPLHAAVHSTENAERRIVFAMDLNTESLVYQAAIAATDAYSQLYLAEAEAVRRIVQQGYREPLAGCRNSAQEAWSEAAQRFHVGAPELIQMLQIP